MWGANKILLQSKSFGTGAAYLAYLHAPEANQLIAQHRNGILLMHISLEGSAEYQLEGLGHLLLHERAYTIYYVPFWLAHALPTFSPNRSMLICMDPSFLGKFTLQSGYIRNVLQKIESAHPVILSDTPYIADYPMLSQVNALMNTACERTCERLAHAILEAGLANMLKKRPPKIIKMSKVELEKFYRARKIITTHLKQEFSRRELSEMTGLSNYQIRDQFPQLFGVSTKTMLLEARMSLAGKMILAGDTIYAVAKTLGYSDESGLRRAFHQFHGLSPVQYRQEYRKNDDEFGISAYSKSG
jgi:AraC-like DNA-binding protein